MGKKYIGHYIAFENPIKSNSLSQSKKLIENSMGDKFVDYETASINEYNILNRQIAKYYFSKGFGWKRSKISVIMYSSWNDAIKPIKDIAQYGLNIFGYKSEQEKEFAKFVQQRQIDELYGRK